MLLIQLNNLRFYSFHGIHEEEKILGNDYELNLKVGFGPGKTLITEIKDTVDYTLLYNIISKHMAIPTPLLETVAGKIIEEITAQYEMINEISISIRKLYPPLNNFIGNVGVSFEWKKPG